MKVSDFFEITQCSKKNYHVNQVVEQLNADGSINLLENFLDLFLGSVLSRKVGWGVKKKTSIDDNNINFHDGLSSDTLISIRWNSNSKLFSFNNENSLWVGFRIDIFNGEGLKTPIKEILREFDFIKKEKWHYCNFTSKEQIRDLIQHYDI